MRTLLTVECGVDPALLESILNYDGTPITARFISAAIASALRTRADLRTKEPAQ